MSTPSSIGARRGAALEAVIQAYFARHGYDTQANQVVQGRSGNAHELDVVARRSDALTEYVTVVEAKAWGARVGKDVVAKLAYVLADLGLHKGIIAAPGGFSSGATVAARELGIELWDGAELERRLGADVLAAAAQGRWAQPPGATATVRGFAHARSPESAAATLRQAGRGRLGLGGERLVWQAALWLPVHIVTYRVADPAPPARFGRRSGASRSRLFQVAYDGLDGATLQGVPLADDRLEVAARAAIAPLSGVAEITRAVRSALGALQRVTSESAVQRHRAVLDDAGLPDDALTITVEGDGLQHVPVYAGLLEGKADQRAVVIDALDGRPWDELSDSVTRRLGEVRAHLNG
ncbi:MAG: restriction endonuclease [Candidatus Microthrix sp.]|nr:restriction endonuclease [Candidatus Microthrix sp.]